MSKLSLAVEKVASRDTALDMLEQAERMVEAAVTIDDAKTARTFAETARQLAKKAHLGLDIQNRFTGVSLEAQAKANRAIEEARARGDLARQSPGDVKSQSARSIEIPTLSTIDVSLDEASAWAKVDAKGEATRRRYIKEATENRQEASRAGLLRWTPGAVMSSESPEWYTPPHVVAAVIAALGAIDLDPCADQSLTIPAARHYTEEHDGLAQPWSGRVYMNPPYGSTIGQWAVKLRSEYDAGNVTAAVALVPARTETDWWASLDAEWVCLIHGRLAFSGHETSAPFPSATLYLGPEPDVFAAAFAALGPIYRRVA